MIKFMRFTENGREVGRDTRRINRETKGEAELRTACGSGMTFEQVTNGLKVCPLEMHTLQTVRGGTSKVKD